MIQIEVERTVAADPASVALLLAGPAAAELWPWGPTRDEPPVTFGPPTRTGVGFTVTLSARDEALGPARGHIALTTAAGKPGATAVQLRLTTADVAGPIVRQRAARFVDELASLAQARSSAA